MWYKVIQIYMLLECWHKIVRDKTRNNQKHPVPESVLLWQGGKLPVLKGPNGSYCYLPAEGAVKTHGICHVSPHTWNSLIPPLCFHVLNWFSTLITVHWTSLSSLPYVTILMIALRHWSHQQQGLGSWWVSAPPSLDELIFFMVVGQDIDAATHTDLKKRHLLSCDNQATPRVSRAQSKSLLSFTMRALFLICIDWLRDCVRSCEAYSAVMIIGPFLEIEMTVWEVLLWHLKYTPPQTWEIKWETVYLRQRRMFWLTQQIKYLTNRSTSSHWCKNLTIQYGH